MKKYNLDEIAYFMIGADMICPNCIKPGENVVIDYQELNEIIKNACPEIDETLSGSDLEPAVTWKEFEEWELNKDFPVYCNRCGKEIVRSDNEG